MQTIALKMLLNSPSRSGSTVAGIAMSFFLIAAQIGMLVGWCNTTSALIRHARVDLWVMAKQTPAFDYGTAIPRTRLYQVRTVEGVEWAEAMFVAWNTWQRNDGRRISVELVGLDEGCVGGPWIMSSGSLESVRAPESVVVDELFLDQFGVGIIGDEGEMYGRRARVQGISNGVRTFTALPFVFTSIESARKYDLRYRDDEITYVIARCSNGQSPIEVRDRIRDSVPYIEVLTSAEFSERTIRYWMLETGAGITVVITAILGFVIGTVIISQTLYTITNEHLNDYATLLAIGVGRGYIVSVIVTQSLILGSAGTFVGAIVYYYLSVASAATPIPLESTPLIFIGIVLATLMCCVVGSLISIRSILRIDPVTVFRA